MGKSTIKRIGNFAEFCKTRDKQLLKENNEVAIDVPFYNQAIESILGEIKCVADDPIDWRRLVDYIKVKYQIIDREIMGGDEDYIIAHVRDLLFQRFGDTFLGGDAGCLTVNAAAVGAKTLVISQLASDILHRIRVDAGLDQEPEPEIEPKPLSTVSLDYNDYDEDYYCGEKRVADYNDFANILKENIDRISAQHEKQALDYCLGRLKKTAGSLKFDDVLKVVQESGCAFSEYINRLVKEYMVTASIDLKEGKQKHTRQEKFILEEAKDFFCQKIAKEITALINKKKP